MVIVYNLGSRSIPRIVIGHEKSVGPWLRISIYSADPSHKNSEKIIPWKGLAGRKDDRSVGVIDVVSADTQGDASICM
jgi:hypothetical protein